MNCERIILATLLLLMLSGFAGCKRRAPSSEAGPPRAGQGASERVPPDLVSRVAGGASFSALTQADVGKKCAVATNTTSPQRGEGGPPPLGMVNITPDGVVYKGELSVVGTDGIEIRQEYPSSPGRYKVIPIPGELITSVRFAE